MKPTNLVIHDDLDDLPDPAEQSEEAREEDLWFLPGPIGEESVYPPPDPRAEPAESSILADWMQAEAGLAARLAWVAGRLGERLKRGPEGWRHRLALIEALTEWPLVSAPMAERLTGASRTAVQRNLASMEAQSLVREVTGQGRFRMWRVTV